jgi:hypothetical protein
LHALKSSYVYTYNAENTRLYPKGSLTKRDTFMIKRIVILDRRFTSFHPKNDKPKLSSPIKMKLYEVYEEDLAALEIFLNWDLSDWNPNPSTLS